MKFSLSILGIVAGAFVLSADAATQVDFARDVRPIFVSRCYDCHGDKKQK
jgi:hypothetical protein